MKYVNPFSTNVRLKMSLFHRFFSNIASKDQLPGLSIIGTLAENGFHMRCLTGFRCTSSGGYNTTFKIQAEISLWQFTFSHKPSQPLFANVAFKNICSGIFLQIIIKACVTEFSSMLKVPCFPHVLLNTEDECI